MQTIQAKELAINDLEAKFGLKLAEDEQFFSEWLGDLPQLTGVEKQSLDHVEAIGSSSYSAMNGCP